METVTCLRCGDFLKEESKTGQDDFCEPCFTLGSACRAGPITVVGALLCALIGLLALAAIPAVPWDLALRVFLLAVILGAAAFQSAFFECHPAALSKARFFFSQQAAFPCLFAIDLLWRFYYDFVLDDYVGLFLDSMFGVLSLVFDSLVFLLVLKVPYAIFNLAADLYFKSRHSSCWAFAEAVRERKAELAREPSES